MAIEPDVEVHALMEQRQPQICVQMHAGLMESEREIGQNEPRKTSVQSRNTFREGRTTTTDAVSAQLEVCTPR